MTPEKLMSVLLRDFAAYARLDGHSVTWSSEVKDGLTRRASGKCSKCGAYMNIETFPGGHFTDGNLDMGRCK